MANDLTTLTPTLFSAAQEVSNEPFGIVESIAVDFDDQGVAFGDAVDVTVAPTRTPKAFTPGINAPAGDDATSTTEQVVITRSDLVDWYLTGEQLRKLENGGTDQEWVRQLIAQGMRALRNQAEEDCATAVKVGASRAIGTAGSSPFASNIDSLVDLRKVLRDNGAPMADLQCVMDTGDGAALRKLGIITDADKAGSAEERRTGNLLRQYGFQLRESAGIQLHTAGTGTGYNANGALAVGASTVVAEAGSGTILAGDIIEFAASADTNQYIVRSALASNEFTINRPGLRDDVADDEGFTLVGAYTPVLGFERSAVVGVMRPPVMPPNANHQSVLISDEMGMTYLLVQIQQYGQTKWELHLASGFKVVQPEHVAILLS